MNQKSEQKLINHWRRMIEEANQNNILCHCSGCKYEWVESETPQFCPQCHHPKIESFSCWQFPDD